MHARTALGARSALALVTLVAAIAAMTALAAPPPTETAASAAAPGANAATGPVVVAYYLHGTQRCKTCRHIESSTEKVLRGAFAQDLQTGRLAWRTADFDRPENEHFIKDFGLVTSSVVLVEMTGQRVVRFRVLDKTWQYARDDWALEDYVKRETAAFLREVGKASRG